MSEDGGQSIGEVAQGMPKDGAHGVPKKEGTGEKGGPKKEDRVERGALTVSV